MVSYLDTSGLVKRYVSETGTAWVRRVCASAPLGGLYIAQITGVEAIAAITRRARQGTISAGDAAAAITALRHQLLSDYTPVRITDGLLRLAMDLAERRGLRGYDAVQLASALEVAAERTALGLPAPVFLSADTGLNAAAAAEGLAVDNPNAHP